MHSNNDGVHITTLRNDNRVFPFGRFMRKTKIDELPQAINILLGHMSVVGPRPEDKEIADKIYLGEYQRIMSVKPGLTSIASLYDFTHGENCESEEKYEKEFLPKKLKLELYYIDNQSIIYDVKLIFKTAWIIFLTVFGKRKFEEPRELKGIKQEDKESVEDFVL
jgi:putative colanic acid biosynthesis UDP-glucose lipid carrier transferase